MTVNRRLVLVITRPRPLAHGLMLATRDPLMQPYGVPFLAV